MSYQAMEAVQDHSETKGNERGVLMAIARFCNRQGNMDSANRTPSIDTISDKANVSRRTTLNIIPALVKSGELSVKKKGNGKATMCRYTINLPISDGSNDDFGYDNGAINGAKEVSNGAINGAESGFNGAKEVGELKLMVQNLTLMVQNIVSNGAEFDANGANSCTHNNSNKINNSNNKTPQPPTSPIPEKKPRKQKKREPKKKLKSSLSDYPELDTPLFRETWESWIYHRQEIKKPLSDSSKRAQLRRFLKEGIEPSSWVINNSISNGWTGLFWEKLASGGHANVNGRNGKVGGVDGHDEIILLGD